MTRPFTFKINAAELFTQIQGMNNDEKATFITQFAVDLLTLKPVLDYSKSIVEETMQLIETRSKNGKLGGRPKSKTKAKVKLNESKIKAKPKPEREREVKIEEEKKEYAEKVTMTEKQYLALIQKFGDQKTALAIQKLSVAKCASKKLKYDSDYHAILKWVIEAVEKTLPQYPPQTPKLKYGDPGYVTDQRKLVI